MLTDVVVDTNVLVHADNPNVPFQESSLQLIFALLECTAHLCVDIDEENSIILYEYNKHIKGSSLAARVLPKLLAENRVKYVSRKVPQAHRKAIFQLIGANTHDRVFARVTCNSISRTLASHDYTDFSESVRESLKEKVGIDVMEAADMTALLAA